MIDLLFKDRATSKLTVKNFICLFYVTRNFYNYADDKFLSFEKFQAMLKTPKIPQRLKEYIEHTWVPS